MNLAWWEWLIVILLVHDLADAIRTIGAGRNDYATRRHELTIIRKKDGQVTKP